MTNRSISQMTEFGYSAGLLIPVVDMTQAPGGKNGSIPASVLLSGASQGVAQIFTAIASVTISGHLAVAASAGGLIPADSATASLAGAVIGISVSAGVAGAAIDVQATGPLTFAGWNWTPGAPVFVGPSGALSQTPPSSGFLKSVGVAETATTLLVSLGTSVIL